MRAWLVVGVLAVFGCGGSSESSTKAIGSLSFLATTNPALTADLTATITGQNIAATVPTGTDVTHLIASFTTTGDHVTVAGAIQQSGLTANDFTSPVAYTVFAADGSSDVYTVTVTVAATSAKEITAFAFLFANNPKLTNSITATITGDDITATVPFGTDLTTLVATYTTTGTSVAIGGGAQTSGVTVNNFTNPVIYLVTAGDGSTRSYTVTLTVAPSTAKSITAFQFLSANNAGLSANVTATITGANIAATVPFGTNVTALVATFTTTGASVTVTADAQVSGTTPNNFTSPVTYQVTAADASTKSYVVTVTIAPDAAKDITSYQFLTASNAQLSANVTATITGTSIIATLPFGSDDTALIATFTTTGASVKIGSTVQVSGATPNNFSNPVTYTVVGADASTKTYTVVVTIAGSPAKDITSYAFQSVHNAGLPADVTATIVGTNITATVPFGTDVTALVATFATSGASVAVGATTQVSAVTPNNFTAAVTYTVTAADTSTKTYTVTIAMAPSPAKDITAFAFRSVDNSGLPTDVIATITGGNTISATVPSGTDVTGLIARFSTTGTSVAVGATTQVSGMTANNFTALVTYTVTAADTTTKDYAVTVTIAPATAKDLTAFAFTSALNSGLSADVAGTIVGNAIALTVPFGTDVTALIATFSTDGASVAVGATAQVTGVTPNDFSAPVTYTVTAADATTQDYTVTVTIAPSMAKDITAFQFLMANNAGLTSDITATITGTAITATVPFGTDVTALVATFVTTGTTVAIGATAQVSGMTANDFTAAVTYTVTAADTSTKAYTVTVSSGAPPTCDVLADPTGGTVAESNGGVFPSTATYTCNAGFLIDGSATRTCASDGTWSGAAPTCDVAVMVVRVGDGVTALGNPSAQVAIEERRATDGGLGRTLQLPIAAAGGNAPFSLSGSSTSEGFLSLSGDGRFVTLAGYAAVPGIASISGTTSAATNRVVARVSAAGVIDTSTLISGAFSASNIRSAASVDGSAFWAAGTSSATTNGGVQYVTLGSAGASVQVYDTINNLRVAQVIGGQLYVSTGSMTNGVYAIGSGTPTTTGQTGTIVIPTSAPYSFAAFDTNLVVDGIDTFYVAIDTVVAGGANRLNIQKWTFDGTNWTQDATFAPVFTGFNVGARGLTGFVSGTTVNLVAVTEQNPSRLVTFADNGDTPAVTVLATPGVDTDYRGVALSPSVP